MASPEWLFEVIKKGVTYSPHNILIYVCVCMSLDMKDSAFKKKCAHFGSTKSRKKQTYKTLKFDIDGYIGWNFY